ncbi:LOW QUALITY PROTEIN: hypothetical protein TorRG33x02_138300, partial [Trema orientale]
YYTITLPNSTSNCFNFTYKFTNLFVILIISSGTASTIVISKFNISFFAYNFTNLLHWLVRIKPSANSEVYEISYLNSTNEEVIIFQFPPIEISVRQPVLIPTSTILMNQRNQQRPDVIPNR